MALDKSQIIVILQNALDDAGGEFQEELSRNNELSLDYYYGRRPGKDVAPDSAQFVSLDVRNQIEATKANILPAIGSDSIVDFEPNGADDDAQAALESDVVNEQIIERNQGYVLFNQALHDALLQRNGVIKVFVEEREEERTEILTPDSMPDGVPFRRDLLQLRVDQINLDPHIEADIESFSDEEASIKIVEEKRDLKLQTVAPENFLYTPNWSSIFLEGIPYTIERHIDSRSDMIEQGFSEDQVNDLRADTEPQKSDAVARYPGGVKTDRNITDPSQQQVVWWEFYIEVDEDEDGISELRHISYSQKEILDDEPAPWIPYAAGTGFLQPHRFAGQSLFDVEKNIQDAKTFNIRQWLNNQLQNNNRRLKVVEGRVNYDQLENSSPAGYVEVKSLDAIDTLPYDDLSQSCMALASYLDSDRTERGGASLGLQSTEAQIVNAPNQATERQMTVKEQLAAMMARNLSETLIRTTYILTHRTIRKFLPGNISLQRSGTWQTTNPATWPERRRVNVKVGLSTGERARRAASLQMTLSAQQQALSAGPGVLVDLDKMYNAAIDWGKALELDNPERYWINPQSPESQQAQQGQQKQQQQMQQIQFQLQQQQGQMLQQTEQIKQQAQAQRDQAELQFKYFDALLDAEIEEAKLVGDAEKQLQLQAMKGRQEIAKELANSGNGAADPASSDGANT